MKKMTSTAMVTAMLITYMASTQAAGSVLNLAHQFMRAMGPAAFLIAP
jgi:hypothetical protein